MRLTNALADYKGDAPLDNPRTMALAQNTASPPVSKTQQHTFPRPAEYIFCPNEETNSVSENERIDQFRQTLSESQDSNAMNSQEPNIPVEDHVAAKISNTEQEQTHKGGTPGGPPYPLQPALHGPAGADATATNSNTEQDTSHGGGNIVGPHTQLHVAGA